MPLTHSAGMPEPGGPALAPQYLADQLTLFHPEEADSAQPLQLAPQNFFTFRHHCSVVTHSVLEWIQVKVQNLSRIIMNQHTAWKVLLIVLIRLILSNFRYTPPPPKKDVGIFGQLNPISQSAMSKWTFGLLTNLTNLLDLPDLLDQLNLLNFPVPLIFLFSCNEHGNERPFNLVLFKSNLERCVSGNYILDYPVADCQGQKLTF